jgi:magnesium-transporting ATPase (P-type)
VSTETTFFLVLYIKTSYSSTTQDGLTSSEVEIRLEKVKILKKKRKYSLKYISFLKFGHNQRHSKKKHPIFELLPFLDLAVFRVMEMAAIVAIVLSNGCGQAPNWEVFIGILLLLFINSIIGFIAWHNSKNLMKAPVESFEMKVNVKRDGNWMIIKESNLVPGDIISIKQDNYFPADARIIGKSNICKVSMATIIIYLI